MYIKITDVKIECGNDWTEDHNPRYCDGCYVHYISKLCATFDQAVSPQTYIIYEVQFTWKKQIDEEKSTGVLTVNMEYADLSEFAPEYFTWIVAKVREELHDDCNWDSENI